MRPEQSTRIVIVGTGFGGLGAYTELARRAGSALSVTLVSRDDYFAHIPLIHEVAAGTMQPHLVTWNVSEYVRCPKKDFVHGTVTAANLDTKTLTVDLATGGTRDVAYDYLVLALGSIPNTPAVLCVPGTEVFSFRTLPDAMRLRNRFLEMFEKAKHATPQDRDRLLSFIFVGGGATGIEVVGECVDMFAAEFPTLFPDLVPHVRVTLIERSDELLKERHPWFAQQARRIFEKNSFVHLLTGTTVIQRTSEGLITSKGDVFGETVVWTGGSKAAFIPMTKQKDIPMDERAGRIVVTPFLHIKNYESIYIVGDQACVMGPDDRPYGMRAQFAVREGKRAAQNIVAAIGGRRQKAFAYKERGFILPIGKWHALAEIFGIRFSGVLAWVLCHAVYIMSVIGVRLRIQTAWVWLKHFFQKRNICLLSPVSLDK